MNNQRTETLQTTLAGYVNLGRVQELQSKEEAIKSLFRPESFGEMATRLTNEQTILLPRKAQVDADILALNKEVLAAMGMSREAFELLEAGIHTLEEDHRVC